MKAPQSTWSKGPRYKQKLNRNGNRFQTQAFRPSVVAIGSSIYFIGGHINRFRCSNVSILDCRSHTWHQAPNMQTARKSQATNVIDGKIYVVGGRSMRNYNSSNWIEFFDPKTQIWNYVSSPGREICGTDIIRNTEIDGKVCMYGRGGDIGVAYNPKDGTCESIELDMCKGWVSYSHCVIDNVLFCYYDERVFKWFDTKARLWRNLKGVEGIMFRIAEGSSVELADYGGKMVVLWDRDVVASSGCDENKVVWCAVIAVERRDGGDEIWGTVEWFDVVLTVPRTYQFVHVLAVTL